MVAIGQNRPIGPIRSSAAFRLPETENEGQDLVHRMRNGEQRAFDQFFDTYASRIGAFAARRASLDAAALEDVVRVTMINAIRGLDSFRGDGALFTWLCQICRNHLADLRRQAILQPVVQSLEQISDAKPQHNPVELTDFRDPLDECVVDSSRRAVRNTVNHLLATHARILELRYGDDLTVLEIAKILLLSESAAESRLARARQSFRDLWGDGSTAGSA